MTPRGAIRSYAGQVPRIPARTATALALAAVAATLPLVDAGLDGGWYVGHPPIVVLSVAAGYLAGAWMPRAAAPPVALVVASACTVANQVDNDDYPWPDDLVFFAVITLLPMLAGAAVTARARQARQLTRLRAEVDEQQRIEVAAARLEEQNRIQREVHAVLAERIGAIALRAEGARRSSDPEALPAIEAESRGVLDQLRAALGSLAPPPPVDPTPSAREASRGPVPWPEIVLAAVLGAAMAVETLVIDRARGPEWANVLAALAAAAPLAVRRLAPLAAVTAACVLGIAMSAWLTPLPATVTGVAWFLVVFYSVGAWCRGWRLPVGLAVAALASLAMEEVSGLAGDSEPGDGAWILLLFALGAVTLGRVTAGWSDRVRAIRDAVGTLERGRDAQVRLAAAEEREALSRSLHDTVAHAMTVVCVQAAAAQRTGQGPGEALRTIATTAATSLAELRDGLEEGDAGDDPLAPARITALGRRLGVDLSVRRSGRVPGAAAATLGYRVVREAVVNVARHATGAAATVRIHGSGAALEVEVTDNGTGAGEFGHGSGKGLAGLADAVAAARGDLAWGPAPEGGFRVVATLPEEAP